MERGEATRISAGKTSSSYKSNILLRVMDIRSIIDAEDVPAVRKPAPVLGKSESQPLPANMSSPHTTQAPDYPERRDRRPPQPSPLQPPLYNDLRSPNDSSYNKVGNSPYQPTSSSSLSSGQYPFPQHPSQSPGYGYQNSQYTQRDSYSASSALGHPSLGHSTPLSQTPTASTPGSANAYSSFPRPTSSHSISTPTSVQPPSFLRGIGGSPQSSGGRTLSQPHPSQQLYAGSPISYSSRTVYPGDHLNHNGQERERSTSVSPKTRVQSLPGNEVWNASSERARAVSDQFTPAKRKIIEQISDNAESTEQVMRQPPRRMVSVGINEMLNAEPASKATEKEAQPQKQYFTTDTSNTALSDPDLISWKSSLSQSSSQAFPTLRSFSNTPYTQPPVPHGPLPVQRASMQPQTPTPPASERQTLAKPEKSSSPNVEMARAFKGDNLATSKLLHDPQSQPPAKRARREGPPTAGSNHSNPEVKIDAQETVPSLLSQPVKAEHLEDWQNAKSLLPPSRTSKISNSSKSPSQPFRKKTRRQPIPIFAQSILGDAHQQPTNHRPRSTNRAAPVTATQANAHTQINGTSLPVLQPTPAINGPLGPWEPSILNVIPSEELVKMVSDFLFREVVTRDDVGVGPAGGLATQGAVLEIEAKIGQLVSKDTNDRLRMAAITECIVSQADPSLRYTFQSSMTEVSLLLLFLYFFGIDQYDQHSPNTVP